MLIVSSLLACMGYCFLAVQVATLHSVLLFVFAAGICFFWPTMLGFVSEYLPIQEL
jgi:hypothetical protein